MSTGLIPGANGDSSICNDGNLDSLVYAVYGFMPISILKAASSSTPRNGHAYKSFSPFRGTIGACFTLHSSLFTLYSHSTQSAMKILVSPGTLSWRFEAKTSLLPSGVNIGKPSNVGL